MKLNNIPSLFANQNRKRRGRGIGSGLGKTAGSGHKGQKARAGHSRRYSFEGGQKSLFKRIPKSGFTSRKQHYSLPLSALNKIAEDKVTLELLKKHKLLDKKAKNVRIYLSGKLSSPKDLSELYCTKGVK